MEHQTFVIARVGKYYRCLAAVHHDYLFDAMAVTTCLRLISIFSDEANRLPLQLELALAANFYKDDGPPPQTTTVPDWSHWKSPNFRPARFPFIGTCLAVGASAGGFRPGFIHADNVRFEHEDMGFDGGQNAKVITVLDITDLRHVRHCFAAWQRIGWRWATHPRLGPPDPAVVEALGVPPPLMKPWTGAEYILHYIRLNDPPDAVFTVMRTSKTEKLAPMPLVRASSLAEVWPWGAWVADDSEEAPQPAHDQAPTQRGGAPLMDQALAKLVQVMVSSTQQDVVGLLEEPKRIPDFGLRLRNHLFAVKDKLVTCPAAPELFKAAFAGEAFLDWSLFLGLAPETIMGALEGPELHGARGLSICPDWNTTSPSALAHAICSFPGLRDLYVMESPGRLNEGPIGELYMALAANPRCPKGKMFLAGAASHALKLRMWLPTTKTFLPPASFPVQQLVIAPFEWPAVGIIRDVTLYHFQLADAFLTPSRFVNGLLTLLTSIAASYDATLRDSTMPMDAAHVFAYSPDLEHPSGVEIRALPAETFAMARMAHSRRIKDFSTKMRDLLPGAWTVLVDIKREPARPRVRGQPRPPPPRQYFQIAFVRPKTKTIRADPAGPTGCRPKDMEILGLEEFLRVTAPEVDLTSLDRRLEEIEKLLAEIASDLNRSEQLSISRRPMDAEAACKLVKHIVSQLPPVHKGYDGVMAASGLTSEDVWYPELADQQPAAETEALETGMDPSSARD